MVQSLKYKHEDLTVVPRTQIKSSTVTYDCNPRTGERGRQAGPGGSVASQPSLLGEFQTTESLSQKNVDST